jgi:hypothetical protein
VRSGGKFTSFGPGSCFRHVILTVSVDPLRYFATRDLHPFSLSECPSSKGMYICYKRLHDGH